MRVFDALRHRPVNTLREISQSAGFSIPAASKCMQALTTLGIARELTGGKRNRVFAYDRYLALLSEGTEPL